MLSCFKKLLVLKLLYFLRHSIPQAGLLAAHHLALVTEKLDRQHELLPRGNHVL